MIGFTFNLTAIILFLCLSILTLVGTVYMLINMYLDLQERVLEHDIL